MTDSRRDDLLERVIAAHEGYYDILRDHEFEGRTFPAFASFHTYGEQYVLVQRAKLWEVETHDYIFFVKADVLNETLLREEIEFVITKGLRKVSPGPNHMSSALSLVIVANSVTDGAAKLAKKAKFRKNYKFSLHGWSDLRLAVVDCSEGAERPVITNAAGKPMAELLASNLDLAKQDK